jgi:hypothetical protein
MRGKQVINNSVYYLCDPTYNGSSEIVSRIDLSGNKPSAGSERKKTNLFSSCQIRDTMNLGEIE